MPATRLDRPVDPARDHVLGDASAAITLVEYGSYACEHCRAANERLASLRDQLGDRLRYVFRHRPLRGSDVARRAAGPVPGRTLATLPVGPSAKVTERLTRTGPGTLAYRMTYEDADMFTAPWTVAYERTRDDSYTLFEYACHEGNTVREAITASRALRKERAGMPVTVGSAVR